MVQKHREQRCKGELKHKEGRGKGGVQHDKLVEAAACHGIKRSVSHSWEGETHKTSKHTHNEGSGAWGLASQATKENVAAPGNNTIITSAAETSGKQCSGHLVGSSNINLWPPFSVTVTPMHNTQPCNSYK